MVLECCLGCPSNVAVAARLSTSLVLMVSRRDLNIKGLIDIPIAQMLRRLAERWPRRLLISFKYD